eukprot:gene13693-4600_t
MACDFPLLESWLRATQRKSVTWFRLLSSSPLKERKDIVLNYRTSINPSKRHRDRLNQELENLSKLLPFPEEVIARLDKLSVLRLSVSYLRNKNFLKGAAAGKSPKAKEITPPLALPNPKGIFSQLFNEAIDGFLIILTYTGVIFFISESVKSHLGYSQSQYLHQSLYSYIHDDDHDELRAGLEPSRKPKIVEIDEDENEAEDEAAIELQHREFVIRMKSVLNSSSSDMYKPFKVSGYMRKLNYMLDDGPDQYGLFAVCQPSRPTYSMLEVRMKSMLFCSKNKMDFTFLDMDARGKDFFGYSKKDLFGRSSYVMVHRADLQHLRCKHTEIIHLGRTTTATFRLLSKSNDWTWICGYARVIYKNNKEDFVVTTNRVMSDEEGDAMMRVRDSEDIKSLARIGLNRNDFGEEESMEYGFPLTAPIDFHAIDLGPLQLYHGNSDAVIAGSITEHSNPDDILKENPEELFDVSEDLLKSSPENILDSPEDFSDTFDMSSPSLQDPGCNFNLVQDNRNPTTCASARSESISTMSDISVEQQMLAQFQRQQSTNSSICSPIRPDGPLDRARESKKNSLTHLAKSLTEMEVNCPPNVVAPPTESNPYLEMAYMQNVQQNNMSAITGRQVSPPQSQGRSITDLTFSAPQQRGYTNFDGFMPNGSYYGAPPNTTCDFREFKSPLSTYQGNIRTNTVEYTNNSMHTSPNSFQSNYSMGNGKTPSTTMHFSQYNMERPPNVTITTPESNLQDLRTVVATNGRSESSPKYPFLSPMSPNLNWSNSQGHGDVNMESVDPITLSIYNGNMQPSQLAYNMGQIMNMQQQQQQQLASLQRQDFPQGFYNHDQVSFRNIPLQQNHHPGLK